MALIINIHVTITLDYHVFLLCYKNRKMYKREVVDREIGWMEGLWVYYWRLGLDRIVGLGEFRWAEDVLDKKIDFRRTF